MLYPNSTFELDEEKTPNRNAENPTSKEIHHRNRMEEVIKTR